MERRAQAIATSDDAWLDELEQGRQPARGVPSESKLRTSRVGRAVSGPLRGPLREPLRVGRQSTEFLRTTPGKIICMMVALTVLLLASGLAMSQSMAQRNRSLETVMDATEPMSAAAHLLTTSLLTADTIAASAFVQPGALPKEDMARYTAAIDQAIISAAQIYEGAVEADSETTARIKELVTEIQRDLPVYAGINERAKVNQRMGNPVGVAYMSEASGVMRTRMLVNAEELNDLTRQDVAEEMRRLSQPQWATLSGLAAALLALAAAQWWLWRTFRRRLNRGFLAATLAVLVAIAWVGASNYQMWRSGSVEYARAAQPWEELTAARIRALEARTDETFALLRRQSVAQSAREFDATANSVSGALDTADAYGGNTDTVDTVAAARANLNGWAAEHAELVSALDSGSYDRAMRILNTRDPATSTAYRDLDGNLSELIASSREATRTYIDESLDATRAVSLAVAILSILAVLCIWIGIRHRLGEYL